MTAPGRGEAGKGRLGCLVVLLLLGGGVWLARRVPGIYWRYYQMQDEVKSQASFAPGLTDDAIRTRLGAMADTFGIPLGPKQWSIKRAHGEIDIRGEYTDSVVVAVPGWHRVFRIHFVPHSSAEL